MNKIRAFFEFIDSKRIFNILFLLAIVFGNYYISVVAIAVWTSYLAYKAVSTQYKTEKILYTISATIMGILFLFYLFQ